MQALNSKALLALQPTCYTTVVNKLGQNIRLLEHPLQGDSYPVIAHYNDGTNDHVYCTDFFDTDDLTDGGDYEPVYAHGSMLCSYELG